MQTPTSPLPVERVVHQRQYGRTVPAVVEAHEGGLICRKVSFQQHDGAVDTSRGVAVSFGLCRERPRVLFGCKEAWWFFLHHATLASGGDQPDSSSSLSEPFLHLAADSPALRAEWRDYFESLSTTQPSSSLKKAGVLWVKKKEGWVRHFVVATGQGLEWLAMDGKLKEITYKEMVLVDDDASAMSPRADGADTAVEADKGSHTAGGRVKAPAWRDNATRLRLFDFHHPLVLVSKKTKRRHTFLFESSEKANAWSALLQERIDSTQRLLDSLGKSRKDRSKKSTPPPVASAHGSLFDPAVEETPDRTVLRNTIRDDCERAKIEAGKTPFGLLWDMHNPDDIRRINESKKAGPPHYRILSLDGGGLRAILECVILERLLEHFPDFLERVDLFAGVSGGSMVCCGLACGYSPNFIRSCFEQHGDFIVPQRVAFNDDGKRNLAGIGAKARYPNTNFRIVGMELLQNLALRDVPNHLLIPSFLLDNGAVGDEQRSWEPRVYHNIPHKEDPYALIRRSAARSSCEKEKPHGHFGGLFSRHGSSGPKAEAKRASRAKAAKVATGDSLTDKTRSLSDDEDQPPSAPASLRRGLSSDDILSTLLASSDGSPTGDSPVTSVVAPSGEEEKKEKKTEKTKTKAGVKKLWKTWRDDKDGEKATVVTPAVAELMASDEGGVQGKAKEAKKEKRVGRMKRLAQWRTNNEADNDAAEGDVTDGEGKLEEETDVDDGAPPIADDSDMRAPVWDYVMASAAAPIVFPSFKRHIDAGIMCNGPALTAAVTVMGANMQDPQRAEDVCVLSLGTGMVNKFIDGLEHDWGLLEWRTTLPELMFKAKDLLSEQLCNQLLGGRYHRINPWLRKKVAMDDPSVIPQLVAIAQSADLTETVEWVGRYFYTEDEARKRRAAWLATKAPTPLAASSDGDVKSATTSEENRKPEATAGLEEASPLLADA